MFDKILIANRGEIACRIIRTCKDIGVKTVCIAEAADQSAQHFIMGDEGYVIDSYLNQDSILDVIKKSGAQAVHPGYGFLSENGGFAAAVAKAGAVFIGPPPEAIESMGSKSQAKHIAEKNGIPTIPGYHGDLQDSQALIEQAEAIGFPILIKASFGGGGKGMRLVNSVAEFQPALEGAQREAQKAFAKSEVILEKYLVNPRHIEVQILADKQGTVHAIGDRDCSLQRRYQKVVEEAPAFGVPDETRGAMHAAAVSLARAVGYEGAGTVEFLLAEDGAFYFLEMNTRLQVEHPVTEEVFGLDLVLEQLKIASGEKLVWDESLPQGHAIEVRLYAEDPDQGFLPTVGKIKKLDFPLLERVDTGYVPGDQITINYDPMLGKLIVHGETRQQAYQSLQQALEQTEISGLKTNVVFFAASDFHSRGIPESS